MVRLARLLGVSSGERCSGVPVSSNSGLLRRQASRLELRPSNLSGAPDHIFERPQSPRLKRFLNEVL
jgi:hypothetical protein